MTREEAIAHGKEQLEVFGGEHREFIEMAIKALEQEPILEKIRAEIEELPNTYYFGEFGAYTNRDDVNKIIDRYRVESEDKI